jgi:hypothetical protein
MRTWDMTLDVDAILRSQGADPAVARNSHPRLVEAARRAISEGMKLIHPEVYQKRFKVVEFNHAGLLLEGGSMLAGSLVSRHLAASSEVLVVLCTIGSALETHASRVLANDAALGLALDALGTAAIDHLSHAVCSQTEEHARALNLRTTIPLSPGMEGWPLADGQAQLFSLWANESIPIDLTQSFMMIPTKSLSMAIGIGSEVLRDGIPCDYCGSRATCSYKARHAR